MFTACVARTILTIDVVIAFLNGRFLAGVRSIKVSLVYTRKAAVAVIEILAVNDSRRLEAEFQICDFPAPLQPLATTHRSPALF